MIYVPDGVAVLRELDRHARAEFSGVRFEFAKNVTESAKTVKGDQIAADRHAKVRADLSWDT